MIIIKTITITPVGKRLHQVESPPKPLFLRIYA